MITSRMLRSPVPQRIPIPTHSHLAVTGIPMELSLEQRVIGHAHDVLSQRIEAVEIVLSRPDGWFPGFEGDEVPAEHFPGCIYQNWPGC